jgi:acyl-CoA reductase-like NAD-dependent aldehyde dehydrogenase
MFGATIGHEQKCIESIDPTSGEVIARFEATDPSDLPAFFDRARAVQRQWSSRSLRDRCAMLGDLRDVIFNARDEVAAAITQETGKPRVEAIFAEILIALDTIDFLSSQGPRWLAPERVSHHNIALRAKSGWMEFEPLGVVAVISPWNYPFSIPIVHVISALAAGNAVLLKPSELTPRTGSLVGDLVARARFPKNIVQVLHGAGDIGAALVDFGPDKVFFTGSVATGQQVAEACGRKLIPSVLELGGKDAMIVLSDADLESASSAAVWGGFTNCGQACLSVERVYVEQGAAQRFIDLCVEKTKRLRVGPASGADVEIGPMIRLRQIEKVEEQLREAVQRGAKINTGGGRRPDLGRNFFEPTVVTQVDHSMLLMREETFGPVLAIQSVASAEEAVALANDSAFGLGASIWTSNTRRARNLASRLASGSVMINDVASYYGICEAPHGGRRASGWGRTHSRFGLLEMVHLKYIDVDHLPRVAKPWWFGYTVELLFATDRFVEFLFARKWKRRVAALTDKRGIRRLLFRRHRI